MLLHDVAMPLVAGAIPAVHAAARATTPADPIWLAAFPIGFTFLVVGMVLWVVGHSDRRTDDDEDDPGGRGGGGGTNLRPRPTPPHQPDGEPEGWQDFERAFWRFVEEQRLTRTG